MKTRLATTHDLPELITLYKAIIKAMNKNGYMFWTHDYPLLNVIEDVNADKVYVILKENIIIACFTLNENNPGNKHVMWQEHTTSFLYLDRLGVNVNYQRQGLASFALKEAVRLTKEQEKDYLRLFVAATNLPALNLYDHNSFNRAQDSFFDTVNGILVEEIGFEIKTK